MKPHRNTAGRRSPRPWGRVMPFLLLVLCGGALGSWGIAQIPALSKQHPADGTGDPVHPGSPEPLVRADVGVVPPTNETRLAALVAPKTQSLAPKTKILDIGANGRSHGLEVTGVQARHNRNRSPLESSPGYYPPADPESLAVLTGRRDAPPVEEELSGGVESLEALARALLTGLERRDERALHALRVTHDEFERILWPELPQSRPITHIPFSEVWGFSTAQSLAGAGRAIGLYGGRRLTFLRVHYARAETFRNFTLLRDVRILTRDPRDGQVLALQLAPSVVERHERYKALIFKD